MSHLLISIVPTAIASITVGVPDSGTTILLVSGGVLSLGLLARFLKSRKK
jgi:hypothetical protein